MNARGTSTFGSLGAVCTRVGTGGVTDNCCQIHINVDGRWLICT